MKREKYSVFSSSMNRKALFGWFAIFGTFILIFKSLENFSVQSNLLSSLDLPLFFIVITGTLVTGNRAFCHLRISEDEICENNLLTCKRFLRSDLESFSPIGQDSIALNFENCGQKLITFSDWKETDALRNVLLDWVDGATNVIIRNFEDEEKVENSLMASSGTGKAKTPADEILEQREEI